VTYAKLPYDPVHDFRPISFASDIFVVIAASESLGVRSIGDLVNLARAQPGKINWASAPGIAQYVFAAFERRAGLGMTLVPYRELAPLLGDLSEGRIQVAAHSLSALMPLVQAGKARVLIVNNRQRAATMPDVPTAGEAGYSELTYEGFTGLFGRRGMPRELGERIAADMRAVAADPMVRERLASVGQAARAGTPAEFSAALEQVGAAATAMVRAIGTAPNP
jgi:tripartite-type tricarboxylate transporter receptor subunit TctC